MPIRARSVLAAVLVLALALTGLQVLGLAPPVASAGTQLLSAGVQGALPATDPASSLWDDATPMTLPLSAQMAVLPVRTTPSTPSVEVRSLNNGTHIAFRITWADATKDNRTTLLQQFRDTVAIQVGDSAALPYLCMGGAGVRMNILQWKADWQADLEEGFHDLQDAFPNFWVDYYPYAIGGPPYEVPDAFPENASQYLVGYTVGNPFSQPLKVTAVEDAVAYGYFTITTQEHQDAIGRGVWSDGVWSVVISRRLDTGDPQDTPISRNNVLAFAVWDGSAGDRGSRKSTTTWVPLLVIAPRSTEIDLVPLIILLVFAIPILAVLLRARKGEPEPPKPQPPEGKRP